MTTSPFQRKRLDASNPSLLPRDLSRCSSKEARSYVDYQTASRFTCLPLGFVEQYGERLLTVASADTSYERKKQIQFVTGLKLRLVYVPEPVLKESIFYAYQSDEKIVEEAIAKVEARPEKKVEQHRLFSGLRDVASPENELLCALIDYALALEASDLHFIPRHDGLSVSVRIKGEIQSKETKLCSPAIYVRMVQRLKILAKLDITNKTMPLDGSLTIPLLHGSVAARVGTLPTIYGESVTLRFLSTSKVRTLTELGLPDTLFEEVHCLRNTKGLVIFCGATGSGKTTSLYAVTEFLARQGLRIGTIEDPVECIVPWMMQTEVSAARGLDYERGLRALLRHDPDVIMIGEVREADLARLACEAALTGHLVLTTMHGGSVEDVMLRLDSFLNDKILLEGSVKMVVHQELVLEKGAEDRTALFSFWQEKHGKSGDCW